MPWKVERTDPEQPPRLVWWADAMDLADCATVDVDDLLWSIEDHTGQLRPEEAEAAIALLCGIVEASEQ